LAVVGGVAAEHVPVRSAVALPGRRAGAGAYGARVAAAAAVPAVVEWSDPGRADPAGGPAVHDPGRAVAGQRRPVAVVTDEPLQVGDVVIIPPEHYLYGDRLLKLRVTEVPDYARLRLEWVRVRGVEVLWNGQDGPDQDVMVRVAAVPGIPRERSGVKERE
jgi:hypothetical protein